MANSLVQRLLELKLGETASEEQLIHIPITSQVKHERLIQLATDCIGNKQ